MHDSKHTISISDALLLCKPTVGWDIVADLVKSIVPRQRTVTFCRNIAVPITRLCRNRCGYCGFAAHASEVEDHVLHPESIRRILQTGVDAGCTEALFLSGEMPHLRYGEQLGSLFKSFGLKDLADYLYRMCLLALDMGLLPHTNAGILDTKDLLKLKRVNASMGLMLENSSYRLCEKGGAHEFSPGKIPAARLSFIEEAGRHGIPFTTGILLGIGEYPEERVESLYAIRRLHETYGHIQEVIIQNFCPKQHTPMSDSPEISEEEFLKTVSLARLILGPEMNIQVSPNLINESLYSRAIMAGANDFGGISPVTEDAINPEKEWPAISKLRKVTERLGCKFAERLPVYSNFIKPENVKFFCPGNAEDFFHKRGRLGAFSEKDQ